MTALSDDEIAEFSDLVAELQQRLEQSFAAHDLIMARQAAHEEENARLRAELAARGETGEPLDAIRDLVARTSELTGQLSEALKPAALDEDARAAINGLLQSLTDNLAQLTELAQPADAAAGKPPSPGENAGDGSSEPAAGLPADPWAAEINALREEFPGIDSPAPEVSREETSQDPPAGAELKEEQPGKQSG